ncbi:recombinase family protein [Rhizobium sp. CFBP 8762]|uniref:recombinase family protein n=1 Tax=Rhizobium sp. CFBP 8762 TaxID=2775279 RepID=UPI001787724B|nr:recombinase family protein [Rhizobium sp. CFBP 8762]
MAKDDTINVSSGKCPNELVRNGNRLDFQAWQANFSPQVPRVAIYCRSAASNADIIKRQCDILRALALNYRWKIVLSYIDDGYSGSRLDRPGLNAMMKAAATLPLPFDIVMIESHSRIARDLTLFRSCVEALQNGGIELISARGSVAL